ncbi:thrombin inhibitor hemalin-like [Cloeon dipterum]|uniref:thrombin inhibitor hemalin-like n=1 Tax=Cloeon dipterum TaxID=197152 RepID=UPI0032204BAA
MLTWQRCLLSSGLFCLLVHVSTANPLSDVSGSSKNDSVADGGDLCLSGPMKNGALIECDAFIPMYTFNARKKECEGYIYGGCGGSKNLFPSRQECEQGCKHLLDREKRSEPSCEQPPETGRCLAAFARFAYDPEKGDCVEFLYGGCGGNQNNFRTRGECLKKCNVAQFKYFNLNDVPTNDKIVVEAN